MKILRINNKRLAIVVLSLLTLLLSGCWDKIEVEESAFIVVLGLDKGEDNKIEVTYVIANPQGGGFTNVTGSTQNEPPEEIVTLSSPDVLSARDLLGATVTRQVSFSHTRTLIIGEEMARSELLLPCLDAFLRDRQIRRDIYTIVSVEPASEFISNKKPQLETRPHKFYEFMSERWKETALVPVSTLQKMVQRIEGEAGLFINVYGTAVKKTPNINANEDEYYPGEIDQTGGNPIQLIGSAVFKNGKMIGSLTGEETRLSMLLRPQYTIPSLLSTLPDPINPGLRLTLRLIKLENNKFDINVSGDIPSVKVTQSLLMDILAIPSETDYATDIEKQKFLENYVEKQLKEKAEQLVRKTQTEFEGDPFLWSELVRKKFATWDEYERYDWMSQYPKANIEIIYDIKIRRIGKAGSPKSLEEPE